MLPLFLTLPGVDDPTPPPASSPPTSPAPEPTAPPETIFTVAPDPEPAETVTETATVTISPSPSPEPTPTPAGPTCGVSGQPACLVALEPEWSDSLWIGLGLVLLLLAAVLASQLRRPR